MGVDKVISNLSLNTHNWQESELQALNNGALTTPRPDDIGFITAHVGKGYGIGGDWFAVNSNVLPLCSGVNLKRCRESVPKVLLRDAVEDDIRRAVAEGGITVDNHL